MRRSVGNSPLPYWTLLLYSAKPFVQSPGDGSGENQTVDAIEYATVTGQNRAGVFYRRAAFVGGFDQVTGLSGDVLPWRR